MNITREKRPDRVICKWKDYEVKLSPANEVWINAPNSIAALPKSEIPNLIKALEEIQK